MCGIFGVVLKDKSHLGFSVLRSWSDTLFELSESRGKEASGIAFLIGDTISIYKKAIRGTKLIKDGVYKSLFNAVSSSKSAQISFIGHSRLATNGLQTENKNNQPVTDTGGVVIHNGIIVNDQTLWKNILKKRPKYEVDTEAILGLLNLYCEKYPLEDAVKKTFEVIEGSASIAFLPTFKKSLVLATNTGSLYYSKLSNPKGFVFTSEKYIMKRFLERHNLKYLNENITHLKPSTGLKINLANLNLNVFNLDNPVKSLRKSKEKKNLLSIKILKDNSDQEKDASVIYGVNNSLTKIKKHDFDYGRIYKLNRCTKCILPETMPNIYFDKDGVCNYCNSYKKIVYKGVSTLRKLVEPYRSKDGKPDCIIAFSGGRDSSYGLHFLKKELNLNPLAYTYDWGMVTDLARRNEARMVGKLGVEHIIVSADITMKRAHIRKHILAWMKKPDLGMVPLFMEGDKQCEYYADELAQKTGIKLIFYCRGNELENEEFKWGHCGIVNATPKGVIHNLSPQGKLQIAAYYFKQYLLNPSYINSSLLDTLFAYYSTYVQKHDYIYLWHYIPWKEGKIVSTLTKSYGWETHPETNTTWRTDDGTSAFYNYIYYTGQGFTENDTFRSNQIREGLLDRTNALRLVNEENKPRHEALKWYFDRVGLDGNKVLTVVDRMPRLY